MTLKKIILHTAFIFGLIAWNGCISAQLIRPGSPWLDDGGKQIQAHGGGIIQLGKIYYWFGEDRS
jgi:hypothetical protein